ncbi:type II toxin-antitoxin system VapC family toxin [bacterium]|nr:type II toxin-antitoxin system VapC family toxin [bacterium]
METVYLETTVVSYLVAHPSRDLVVSAHQQITREWWDITQKRFKLFVSEAVLEEISRGDSMAVARRQEIVKELPVLELNEDVRELVRGYEKRLGLPKQARADIVHIAFAVAYKLDYLLTWNCSHIANGEVIRRLLRLNKELKRLTPIILTPEELLEPISGENT